MSDRQDATQYENELNRLWNDLNRLWNDLVSRETNQDAYDLPAGDAQMLSHFQQRVTRAQPDSARERAWQRTLANIEFDRPQNAQKESTLPTIATLPPSGHLHSPNGRAASRRWGEFVPEIGRSGSARRWGIAQLTIAAVLLLAGLGIGYIVFGPGFGDDEPRTTIPAAVAPVATPSPAPFTEESLLEVTIPAAALPQGEGITAALALFTIPVGTRSTWTPYCCDGPMIEQVLAGTYAVRAEAAIQVVRADGTVEETPAGVEVTLGPGDSVISRNEVVVEGANTGDVPVELLNWVLIEAGDFNGHVLPGWSSGPPDAQGSLVLSMAPATIRLRRIELAGGATFPAPAAGTLVFMLSSPLNDAGTPAIPRVAKMSDGELVSVGTEPNLVYLLTLEQVVPPSGSPTAGVPSP